MALWRMATTFTVMDVKGSTTAAKFASYMTLVYHYLVYMVMYRLVTTKDSMMSKVFVDKLTAAKTAEQLDTLVNSLLETQFPSPIKKNWNIPTIDQMEKEIIHLTTDWNDQRVSIKYLNLLLLPFIIYSKDD